MNISALTDEEIMRVISPNTELEALLMQRLEDALGRADYAEVELGIQSAGWDGHECDCSIQDERIDYLEEVLDEHKIKYNQ